MESVQTLIRGLVSPLSVPGITMIIWLAVMISVPILRWVLGAGAERIGIAAGVIAQATAVVVTIWSTLGIWTLVLVVIVPVLGWASEAIGSRTGIPFGKYHYTSVLQPQVARVPVLIPLAWLMMMPPAWAVGVALAPGSRLLGWVIAALAFTAWDLYLDPQMVAWDFWRWDQKGAYLGIPIVNYVGWFAVAFLITAGASLLTQLSGITLESVLPPELLIVFLVTWILQFIGQLFFWGLRVSAITGFLVMGLFSLALLIR